MIVGTGDLHSIRERHKRDRVVYALGCFDLFHVGHLSLFEQAKKLGDILVVSAADDERVKQLKGPTRPIIGIKDRIEIINALRCVDYVLSHPASDEDVAIDIIRKLQPDIFVNSSPERMENIKKIFPNITYVHVPPREGMSTGRIIDSIKKINQS